MPRGSVVARDLLQAGVDDGRHAGNSDGRLGDVGGDDDPRALDPLRRRAHGPARLAPSPPWSGSTSMACLPTCAAIDSTVRRISAAPGRKQSTSPTRRHREIGGRTIRGGVWRVGDVDGKAAAGNLDHRTAVQKIGHRLARRASPTSRRCAGRSRARQACLASAIARSAWMLRSWNSSMMTVLKSERSGSDCRRAVRMPSVTTSRLRVRRRTGDRSGPASRPHARASIHAPRRFAWRWLGPPLDAAAAGSPGRHREAQAACASSFPRPAAATMTARAVGECRANRRDEWIDRERNHGDRVSRGSTPTGQLTPVPPRPQ